MSSRQFRNFLPAIALPLFLATCQDAANQKTQGPPASTTVTADDVLDRCVATYSKLRKLHASGVFRDNRQDERRAQTITWDFERPDKCRVRIGQDITIVLGDACWNYDSKYNNFKRAKLSSRTPMETAAYVMTRGVSFLLPALFERDEAAFGRSRVRGYVDWRLAGVAWLDEHPCYVVSRRLTIGGQEMVQRVWIDQDSYLLRAWDLIDPAQGSRNSAMLAETLHELVTDGRPPADTFNPAMSPEGGLNARQ